ncbi:hypothetical protein PJK55_10130 [Exiguobacterium sp. MMG028]|uniref:hypothetical protein n=1 Tax=Exiguobacterium sp. MMG028 TaxID=3021979 RepID=UPI0022FF0518|nr:hypothetical protein [Exiguobacterium sp. MMG028]MDA5561090.1 hypothetical protein [Exiguobacterium sp. MMG028]
MIQRIAQTYCQMSSLITGFFIVFAFLFGIRSYFFWATVSSSLIAIGLMLVTAVGLSVITYTLSEKLRLFIYTKLPIPSSTCSINSHTK